ncbi:DoxX family protein [Pseudoalteromonas ardens]|uniref:Quinol oxidase n=1 Tax=Pseudoalteromonas rubra TaxID=43658 RepID=A0A0L0ESD2_9GAMM|nr:DoxX family protein [Pseudoalteromonas sp. R96]KNC67265.1 quinol oxidase [Pseudoalteromonas rubra]MDK1310955.1 DoxX family protein [Pseudoalteromonas sp. R96]
MFKSLYSFYRTFLNRLALLDGLAPLMLRLILAPVMIIAGYSKLNLANPDITGLSRLLADENVVAWFGNSDWGLGLPAPDLLAFLAGWTEFLGGWLLLIGLATRLVSIPLAVTMFVAATQVHWHNGWFSVAPSNPDTSAAQVFAWLGSDAAKQSLEASTEVADRLSRIKEIVAANGLPEYLYEYGNPVILNNGIEFAAIYFAMLISLLFTGGGRYFSVDYWVRKPLEPEQNYLP